MKYYISHSFDVEKDSRGFVYRSDCCFDRRLGSAVVYTSFLPNGELFKIKAYPLALSIQANVTRQVLEMGDPCKRLRPHNIKIKLRA